MIRIRRIWNHPPTCNADAPRPPLDPNRPPGPPTSPMIRRAWRVLRDGTPLPFLVVDCQPGLAIIRDHHPYRILESWHAGVTPGDLARHYIPIIEARP